MRRLPRSTGAPGDFPDLAPDEEKAVQQIVEMTRRLVQEKLLNERDVYILQRRVPFPGYERQTQEAIGKELGISKEAVRQRESKAFRRLRGLLRRDAIRDQSKETTE